MRTGLERKNWRGGFRVFFYLLLAKKPIDDKIKED